MEVQKHKIKTKIIYISFENLITKEWYNHQSWMVHWDKYLPALESPRYVKIRDKY